MFGTSHRLLDVASAACDKSSLVQLIEQLRSCSQPGKEVHVVGTVNISLSLGTRINLEAMVATGSLESTAFLFEPFSISVHHL